MYRRHIHAVCNCSAHFGPVRMRYGGRRPWGRYLAYVMYCPFSGLQRVYVRQGWGYKRVA